MKLEAVQPLTEAGMHFNIRKTIKEQRRYGLQSHAQSLDLSAFVDQSNNALKRSFYPALSYRRKVDGASWCGGSHFNKWRGVLTDEKEVLDVTDDGRFDDRGGQVAEITAVQARSPKDQTAQQAEAALKSPIRLLSPRLLNIHHWMQHVKVSSRP